MCIEINLRPGGRSLGGIAGSNAARGMDAPLLCCVLACRGLCDGLIPRPEYYRARVCV